MHMMLMLDEQVNGLFGGVLFVVFAHARRLAAVVVLAHVAVQIGLLAETTLTFFALKTKQGLLKDAERDHNQSILDTTVVVGTILVTFAEFFFCTVAQMQSCF